MNNDEIYLTHIIEATTRIESYTEGGREAFLASTLIQDAVVRNLQTLCESTQRLSATIKASRPTTDWRGIANVRNILVHEYVGLDLEAVWAITENDLPKFKPVIEQLLAAMKGL